MATSPALYSKHPPHLCHSLHVPKSSFCISCFLQNSSTQNIPPQFFLEPFCLLQSALSLSLLQRAPLCSPSLPEESEFARGKSLNQPEAPCGFRSSQLLPSLTRFINILSFSALCFLMKLLSRRLFRNHELNFNYAQRGLCSHIPLLLSSKHGMGESFSHTCSPTTVAPIRASNKLLPSASFSRTLLVQWEGIRNLPRTFETEQMTSKAPPHKILLFAK